MADQKLTMAHTPGPWSYRWETEARDWAIVTDANGSIVANVNTETGPDASSAPATRQMPAEANAHLIAAAPDLLKALAALQKQALQSPDLIRTEWGQEALGLTKAALTKATGGGA